MLLNCSQLKDTVKLSHVLTWDNLPEFVMKECNCFAFFPLSYWIELSLYVRFYCASFKASVGKYRIQKKSSKYADKEFYIYLKWFMKALKFQAEKNQKMWSQIISLCVYLYFLLLNIWSFKVPIFKTDLCHKLQLNCVKVVMPFCQAFKAWNTHWDYFLQTENLAA